MFGIWILLDIKISFVLGLLLGLDIFFRAADF